MDVWLQDVRYSLRSLAKQPGFVVVAVLSLALGIGVNTAIFSVLNTSLLQPFPLRDLDRTVIVFPQTTDNHEGGTSFRGFQEYRDRTDIFSTVMAVGGARPLFLIDGARRDQVYGEVVTADFFSLADVRLQLGRAFDREVDRTADPPNLVVLSHAFWQRRFASDPSIVGKNAVLNGTSFTVIGVASAGFTGFDLGMSTDVWIPMTSWAYLMNESARLSSEERWMTTIAQLKPGVNLQQARAAMAGQQSNLRPAGEMRSDSSAVEMLLVGAGAFAVGLLVLALACTNVANLLIARAAVRQREMAVRMALGASRAQLIRFSLSETLLLCLAAGGISIIFASWLLDLIVAVKLPTLLGQSEAPTLALNLTLDFRIFAFALVLSVLTAIVVGLISAFAGLKPDAMRSMKTDRATDRSFAPGFNVRSTVIALQMALSLLLLIPCGLFVRSWLNASSMSTGFSTERVLLLPISTDQAGIKVQKPVGFDLELAERVARLPGVEAATVMDPVPLWFSGNFAFFTFDGSPQRMGYSRVAPHYFETLKIPLLAGRDFDGSDSASSPQVAIINETTARRFWPNGQAIGKRIRDGDADIEIVGVARDARYMSLAQTAEPWLYVPLSQNSSNNTSLSLALRTAGDPLQLRAAVEREVRALVPAWPNFQFRTLDEGLQLQRLLPRTAGLLLGILGMFGLLLATIGVYGVMAYVVRQRTRELGIRLALGSSLQSVILLVVRQGMAVCVAGAVIGLVLTFAATRLLGSLLYGISASDPLTYLAVLALLLAIATLACYLPARRIVRLNPLEVLRDE